MVSRPKTFEKKFETRAMSSSKSSLARSNSRPPGYKACVHTGKCSLGTLSATFEITCRSPVASMLCQKCSFDVHASHRQQDIGATFCRCQTSYLICPLRACVLRSTRVCLCLHVSVSAHIRVWFSSACLTVVGRVVAGRKQV